MVTKLKTNEFKVGKAVILAAAFSAFSGPCLAEGHRIMKITNHRGPNTFIVDFGGRTSSNSHGAGSQRSDRHLGQSVSARRREEDEEQEENKRPKVTGPNRKYPDKKTRRNRRRNKRRKLSGKARELYDQEMKWLTAKRQNAIRMNQLYEKIRWVSRQSKA